MLLSLENYTLVRMSVKHPARVKISNFIVIFFNGMDMSDYGSKCYEYFGTEKSSKAKLTNAQNLKAFIHLIPQIW